MEYPHAIEMKTIRTNDKGVSQDEQSNTPVFKILIDTKCAKAFILRNSFVVSPENPRTPTLVPRSGILTKTNSTIRKIRYTSIILRQGEIYSGNVIIHKNRIYIDITECYNYKTKHDVCRDISIYIPVIFDLTGKYMMNVCMSRY